MCLTPKEQENRLLDLAYERWEDDYLRTELIAAADMIESLSEKLKEAGELIE